MSAGVPVPAVAASRPTLESVARVSGVSRQTVSNALNAPHLLRKDTLDRVHAAIAEVGYRPSHAARQLRTRRSRTLGMRLEPARDGINGSVLDRFLHALVDGAQAAGYRVLLFTASDDDMGEITAYRDLLATADIDGFLLTSTHHGDPRTGWLQRHGVPFATFGRPWGAPTVAHAWVDIDGAAGTRSAVAHCAARGHRRIAFLGWPAGSGVGDDRRLGWERGLADAGLPTAPEALEALVPDGTASGRTAAAALLRRSDPPTAFVCASDSLALGAWGAASDLGGGAPRVAVVGFDDTPVAAAVGLTSIAQPLADAARACLDQLLPRLDRDAPPPQSRLLAPQLVVRSST